MEKVIKSGGLSRGNIHTEDCLRKVKLMDMEFSSGQMEECILGISLKHRCMDLVNYRG